MSRVSVSFSEDEIEDILNEDGQDTGTDDADSTEDQDEEDGGEEDEGGDEKPEGELILGKFKTQADLEAAYKSLEQRLGSGGKPAKATTLRLSGDPAPSNDAASGDDGVDFSTLDEEFAQGGKISDETYEKFAKAKISRGAVDRYVRGLQAEADAVRSGVLEVVGGEENLTAVLKWAKANLTADERQHFDRAIQSGASAAKLMVGGVYARYVAATGDEGERIEGKPVRGTSTVKPFADQEEYVEAIMDPRYDTDKKFRKRVDARLAVSDF